MTYTHRIRRCEGNKSMLYITPLRPDGSELDLFLHNSTAGTVDALLERNRDMLARPGVRLEMYPSVYATA